MYLQFFSLHSKISPMQRNTADKVPCHKFFRNKSPFQLADPFSALYLFFCAFWNVSIQLEDELCKPNGCYCSLICDQHSFGVKAGYVVTSRRSNYRRAGPPAGGQCIIKGYANSQLGGGGLPSQWQPRRRVCKSRRVVCFLPRPEELIWSQREGMKWLSQNMWVGTKRLIENTNTQHVISNLWQVFNLRLYCVSLGWKRSNKNVLFPVDFATS